MTLRLRRPHGMGDLLGPAGLLKASLNEPNRKKMKQKAEDHVKSRIYIVSRVSKPSILLTSDLPNFHISPGPPQNFLLEEVGNEQSSCN
jgi:hypothetical protein